VTANNYLDKVVSIDAYVWYNSENMGKQIKEKNINHRCKLKRYSSFSMLVALLVLVMIGSGGYFVISARSRASLPSPQVIKVGSTQKITGQANVLSVKGDYAAAIKLLNEQIATAKTANDKQALQNSLIATYINAGQKDNAIKALEGSLQGSSDKGRVYQSIGKLYLLENNKNEAIKYYKLAINNWNKDDPLSDLEIKSMQDELKQLGQAV
jgi:tetratricopeptide (TPR) repeat protein